MGSLTRSRENALLLLIEREKTNTAKGEVTAIKRSGVRFPCEYSTSRFVDADGQIRCCTEFIDLSKWKEEESRIKQSELNLKAIFNSTPDGFVLLDRNFTILACNEKANTFILLNADHKAVDFKINSSIFDYLEDERQNYFRMVCNKALSGEVVEYERSIRASDDVVHWFCFSVQPVWEGGTVAGLCISGRDITGQKQAEQQFISSEQRFRALVENNQDGIAILSADHRVLYVSPAGEQITRVYRSRGQTNGQFCYHP